jgi:hypothetical protein
MSRPAICCCVALLTVATACGSARGAGTTVHHPMAAVTAPRPERVSITGGTARQRALLRRIVAGQRPAAISALRIAPADPAWKPLRPGDVALWATLSPARANLLGEWESWVIGGAFRDRSAALGLPRVVVVGDDDGASRVAPSSIRLPAAPPAALPGFARRVHAILRRLGVHIAYLGAGVPDGYTAEIGVQTAHPAPFLQHRLEAVDQALFRLHSDGWYLAVYDGRGRLVQAGGNGGRLGIGGAGVVDHRYDGCWQPELGPPPDPFSFAPALFCPTDWRPPASRPARPLQLTRTIAEGTHAGYGADGGAHVRFQSSLRFGVGFGLQNLNGARVQVLSIRIAGAPGTAIRFTGLRIQVPPRRLHPGQAGRLAAPYGPLPPLRPFTIRPGDWVGVAMHFRVAACTPATSGRTFVSDRTVTVSWLLRGRTMRHTYRSLPLLLHVPVC